MKTAPQDTVYFKIDGEVYRQPVGPEQINHCEKSREAFEKYLSDYQGYAKRDVKIITEEEYGQEMYTLCRGRLEAALADGNYKFLFSVLAYKDNTFSRKAFLDMTGVVLPPAKKASLARLKEHFGEKYLAWQQQQEVFAAQAAQQKKEEARKSAKARAAELLDKWLLTDNIDSDDFLFLCDRYRVSVSPRTKGFVTDKLLSVRSNGTCSVKGGKRRAPDGFCAIYSEVSNKLRRLFSLKGKLELAAA